MFWTSLATTFGDAKRRMLEQLLLGTPKFSSCAQFLMQWTQLKPLERAFPWPRLHTGHFLLGGDVRLPRPTLALRKRFLCEYTALEPGVEVASMVLSTLQRLETTSPDCDIKSIIRLVFALFMHVADNSFCVAAGTHTQPALRFLAELVTIIPTEFKGLPHRVSALVQRPHPVLDILVLLAVLARPDLQVDTTARACVFTAEQMLQCSLTQGQPMSITAEEWQCFVRAMHLASLELPVDLANTNIVLLAPSPNTAGSLMETNAIGIQQKKTKVKKPARCQ
jgi:hypothetical protein